MKRTRTVNSNQPSIQWTQATAGTAVIDTDPGKQRKGRIDRLTDRDRSDLERIKQR